MQRKFSKRAKLSKLDHFFIIAFLIGAIYLGIIFRLIPFAIVYSIAILYLIFIVSLEYRDTNGSIYQSELARSRGNILAMWGWLNKSPHDLNFLTAFMP
ncbi:hypothetical protein M1439_01710 [Candidatus Marsarchaeota archaeon]|jgi:hypothetical protein|nr:hypothetical protein [Candidatus Marsarchaeota archaeon]